MEWGERRISWQVSDASGSQGRALRDMLLPRGCWWGVRVIWGSTVGAEPYYLGPYPHFGEVGIGTAAALFSSCIFTASELRADQAILLDREVMDCTTRR